MTIKARISVVNYAGKEVDHFLVQVNGRRELERVISSQLTDNVKEVKADMQERSEPC